MGGEAKIPTHLSEARSRVSCANSLSVHTVGEISSLADVEEISGIALLNYGGPDQELLHLHKVNKVLDLRGGKGGEDEVRLQGLANSILDLRRLGEAGGLETAG